jgi:hypothetical protein
LYILKYILENIKRGTKKLFFIERKLKPIYAIKNGLKEILELIRKDIANNGLDIPAPSITWDLARSRMIEVALALNRLRTLKCN